MTSSDEKSCAYTTLVTRPSYLAGVIILAFTLKRCGSKYPLVVLYTDTLPQSCVSVLKEQGKRLNLVIMKVEPLLPNADLHITLIAERFADTWTKLRAFQLFDYRSVCYLDADMMILKNMDSVFDIQLFHDDWLAATPICCCNLDGDAWAPKDWTAANCAYTAQHHPAALSEHTDTSTRTIPTQKLLNGGTFLFHPSRALWDRMLDDFNTSPKLAEYKFPDQDYLADFFRDRWISISWKYNALKTMRYWHPNIWRDDEVVCLHYIVDKPWARRIKSDGVAGYLGRDGVTHGWWWKQFEDWRSSVASSDDSHALKTVQKYMASPLSATGEEVAEENSELSAVGAKVQAYAGNWQNEQKC